MEERFSSFLLFAFTFNLIITGTQQQQHHQSVADLEQGSGYTFSGDDGTVEDDEVTQSTRTEGSGGHDLEGEDTVLTPCQRQQLAPGTGAMSSSGAFRPQCTSSGKFRPTQCDSKKCWCVDADGIKNLGTETLFPSKPRCGGKDKEIIARTRSPPAAAVPDFMPDGHITDDITIEEPSTLRPIGPERTATRKTSKTQSTSTTNSPSVFFGSSDGSVNAQKPAFFSFLFRDPLIFAGIIGGAVLALLCIILLVMFTIYRMRKKDEGSYALDEPKKSYGFAYKRARDKEFFA